MDEFTFKVVLNGELKIRIDNLKIKILTALNKTISICHKNNDRYDNEADSERKIKRANEFVTRFSRNYLYQLRRQIEIMKRLNLNQSCAQAFYQKMFISYQLSLQALQTCQTFLPDTSKLSSDKLVEFIELFLSLLELSKNQLGDTSESDEIRKLCVSLINILKNNVQNQECTAASNNSLMSHNSTNVNHKLTKSSKIKIKNRKSPKKLSMYASNGDLPSNWKKTSATLAKKKFGLPNKNISSNLIKNQKNSNDDKNNGEIVSEDNKYKQVDDDNLELPKNTEERTKVFLLFDKLSEIILQGREENENLKLDKEYDPEKHSQISEIEIKKVVQQIQEIYVQSESLGLTRNSLDEKCFLENSNNNLDIDKKNNSRKTSKYPNNVHFTSIKFNEEKYNSLNNQKHSNDQDVFPCIELNISDKEYQSVVEYRNSFLNYTSNSPVYGKFDERWTIVRRLADDLLSTLLSDVCKELEVNALIQKMYSLEFATQFHVTT
ncbi:uncharacterized protein LOC142322973 [Lycorma delicatula]|uniref:uncharacterized protein LOC142322973 n=1 Tax=Lycorma delicatula TaxID=130591 RepID=UPI003F512298